MIPACPSLMCSFNMDNIEGTNFSKICVWCLCMSCMFYVGEVISFVDWLDRGLIYMWEEFRNVYLLMTRVLTVLRWPCMVDRTSKSNYYYNSALSMLLLFSLSVLLYLLPPSLCIYCDAESVRFVLVLLLILNAWVIIYYICSFDFDDWFVLQIFTWWAPYCIR